jgi:hypothetical protein
VSRLPAVLALLLLCHAAAAAPPPRGLNTPTGACNLQIQDLGRHIQGEPTLTVQGTTAAEAPCALRDDGVSPADMTAADLVWGCLVALPGEGPWTMKLRTDTGTWTGTLPTDKTPSTGAVFLTLSGNSIVLRTDITMSAPVAGTPAAGGPGRGSSGPASTSATTTKASTASASTGFRQLTPGAWTAMVLLVASLVGPVLVARRGTDRGVASIAVPGIPARAVGPAQVPLLVQRLVTSGHRVVVLGDTEGLSGVTGIALASTPAELLGTVEWISAVPGPPVALVVLDPDLLERDHAERWRDLADGVRGRFPCYGVSAPWPPWSEGG